MAGWGLCAGLGEIPAASAGMTDLASAGMTDLGCVGVADLGCVGVVEVMAGVAEVMARGWAGSGGLAAGWGCSPIWSG